MNSIKWTSEMKTVFNPTTGKTYYYILVCNVWRRVSKLTYCRRDHDSDASGNYLTRIDKAGKVHNSKTIYGEYLQERG